MHCIYKIFAAVLAALVQFAGLLDSTVGEYDLPVDLNHGGDPFIVEDGENTYYTYTTGGGVVIRRIAAYNDTTVLEEKTVYSAGSNGILRDIWAPEIHKIGDRWYIVACALFDENSAPRGKMPEADEYDGNTDYYRYGFVLKSKTEDIFGEYEFKAVLAPDGLNNIDGTYLQKDGKLYYVFSGYVDTAHQCIYIAEMENPYTLKENSAAVMLSRPEYSWEQHGWKVNEGPAVLYKGENTYVFYSASGFSSGEYCMGMLTLFGDDVMSAGDWYKSPISVYKKQPRKNIYHTGHCCFLYRENGDIYMVYHATDSVNFSDSPRCTYIKKLEFLLDYPIFY